MEPVLLGVAAYVAVQLVVGLVVSRRVASEDDYLLAGRSLGTGMGTFTIFATWFGAETCIGAAGRMYEHGLSGGMAEPFGYGLCLLLMGLVFAVPLWRRRLTTLADLFRERFSPGVERAAVLLLVPGSLLWAAAQIRAFGQVLSAASGVGVTTMVTVAAATVIVYTVFGGLMADAVTDLFQGGALVVGLVVLLVAVLVATGGAAEAVSGLAPARLSPFGAAQTSTLSVLERWAIPVCGSVFAQELVAKVLATRSPETARRATLLGGTLYLVVGSIPVFIGVIGFRLVPGLAEPEQLLPVLARELLPDVLFVVFAGALVSAILSTVDSALLAASSLVSRNLVGPLLPDLGERGKVRLARVAVVCFGVVAWSLALSADGVYALVEAASAFGSAGVFTVVVFGLFSRFGGSRAALGSLVAGVSTWTVGAYWLQLPLPYLTSLASSALAYVVLALLPGLEAEVESQPPEPALE